MHACYYDRPEAQGYFDTDGNPISLSALVKKEPEWATNVITLLKARCQRGQARIDEHLAQAANAQSSEPLVPDSLVICETASSYWHYHLRGVAKNGKLYLGGKENLRALCNAPVGWDTEIPLSAWGIKQDHIPQSWCQSCQTIAEAFGFRLSGPNDQNSKKDAP